MDKPAVLIVSYLGDGKVRLEGDGQLLQDIAVAAIDGSSVFVNVR